MQEEPFHLPLSSRSQSPPAEASWTGTFTAARHEIGTRRPRRSVLPLPAGKGAVVVLLTLPAAMLLYLALASALPYPVGADITAKECIFSLHLPSADLWLQRQQQISFPVNFHRAQDSTILLVQPFLYITAAPKSSDCTEHRGCTAGLPWYHLSLLGKCERSCYIIFTFPAK